LETSIDRFLHRPINLFKQMDFREKLSFLNILSKRFQYVVEKKCMLKTILDILESILS